MADVDVDTPIQEQPPKLTVDQFAAKIKAKYPSYANIDNATLTQKIIAKYPEYGNNVDFKQQYSPSGIPTTLPTSSPQSELTPIVPDQREQYKQQQQAKAQAVTDHFKQLRAELDPEAQKGFDKAVELSTTKHPDNLSAPTKEETDHYNFMQTPIGKALGSVAYLGSEATHGTLQVAKGIAHAANMGVNPTAVTTGVDPTDEAFKKADKFADFGLTANDKQDIENMSLPTVNGHRVGIGTGIAAAGQMVNFAPSLAGGEAAGAPKTMLYLQGLGQAKELADKMPDLNPVAKEALIQGGGLVNMALADFGGKVFGKGVSSAIKDKVVQGIAADALKEAAAKGLGEDGYKNLINGGVQSFAEKFDRAPSEILKHYVDAAKTLTKLNVGNYAVHKAVDAINDKPVFNETLGNLAENESNTLTKQVPLFGSIGALGATSKLLPNSSYENEVTKAVITDPSKANIDNIKYDIEQHGHDNGWNSDDINATHEHIDKIANAVNSLPSTIKDKTKAVGLVLDRNELQSELDKSTGERQKLDPAIAELPNAKEQYLTDKIEQANDKLRALVTGNKLTVSKGIGDDEGNFYKTIGGKQEPIEESRYKLDALERDSKINNSPITQTENESTNEKGSQEKSGTSSEESGQKENAVPAEEKVSDSGEVKAEPDNLSVKERLDKDFGSASEYPHAEKSKFFGKSSYDATDENGYKISISPTKEGHMVALGKPGKDAGNVDSFNEIQTWFPENESELKEAIDEAKQITNRIKVKNNDATNSNTGIPDNGSGTESPESPVQSAEVSDRETKGEEKEPDGEVKKKILTQRAYEGEISDDVKKYLEEKGLTRKSFSQEERSKQAGDFINKFGEEAAFHAVKSGDIDGGMAASILAQLQIKNSRAMGELPTGSDEREELAKKQAEYISLMEKKGYEGGEFNGQLAHEYENEELNYANVKKQVEKLTGKEITPDQAKKIKDITEENERLKKQAEEAEAKLIEETDKAFKSGAESVKDETKAQKAKRIADKLRKNAKILRPGVFNSASPAVLVWDTAVEITAKSIEAGGKIADAVEKGLEHIRNTYWYKSLGDNKKALAEKEFKNFHHDTSGSTELADLQERFLDKKDNKFTPSEARDIWGYMKENYLNNGTSYRDAVSKTADDLGLSWRQVSEAVITPKTKRMSDEMWKRQSDYTRNRTAIKNWVEDQNKNKAVKLLKKISGAFRGVAVFGHGGIFMGTHAGMTLFNPSTWNRTIPAFFKGWKFAYGNEGDYHRSMEELKNSPNYVIAQRAGLKNNPERLNAEEYQKSQKYLGKLGVAGERGFNAVKVLRQSLFDYHYNKLSPAERDDPSTAVSIAHLVNLATGATNVKIPAWVNEASFAGGMEASRWEKLTASPMKATEVSLKAIFTPSKATTAEKVFAKVWARRVGEQLATYSSILLANAAIQNTINPNNKVNLNNPNASDFLKFKFGDVTIDPTSGMRSTAMFIHELATVPFENQKKLHGDNRLKVIAKDIGGYARGKLSPLYSTGADFVGSQDFNRNVMPYSKDKPTGNAHKLTWPEYAFSKAPLPIAEAINVTYQSALEHHANKAALDDVFNGILSGAISGTTGFRVGEYNARKKLKDNIRMRTK